MTFFVAKNDGSVLLSCTTTLVLGLIQPRTSLDNLPPRASLITSSVDHPQKTRCQVAVHSSTTDSTVLPQKVVPKQEVPKLVTSKEQVLKYYPDVFEGMGKFPGLPYNIQLNPGVPPKQTPCCPIPVHLKEAFQQEVNKMLQVGMLKPVQEATPWINSFVLVEGKDKSGNLKLRICLDPTNLNKAIMREPYHFKTPEDIAHLIADAYIMTVCDYKKGYWHQQLDEAASYITTFNTELGRFRYTVMLFGTTVAGDVFQHKLDLCFGQIKNGIVIALTKLLATARKCNVCLNYDKLQHKMQEVDYFG